MRKASGRDDIPTLYHKARRGNVAAWSQLQGRILIKLLRSLEKYRGFLAGWEIRDVARDATTSLHPLMKKIPTWRRAWGYVESTALNGARKLLEKKTRGADGAISVALSLSRENACHEIPDPRALDSVLDFDLEDFLDHWQRSLKPSLARLFRVLRELRGHWSLRDLSERLGVSQRTVQRQLKDLEARLIWALEEMVEAP